MKATVFLGGGRITSALLAGLRLSGYEGRFVVHDRHPAKLHELERRYRVMTEPDLGRAVAQARLLFIAVRPDSVADLLDRMPEVSSGRHAKQPMTICSLAAGIPIKQLRARLKQPAHWARAMPSPACRSGRGLTAIAFEKNVPLAVRRELTAFFARVGPVLEVPERKFDAFTVTYSCSHGYHALTALAGAGERLGLDRKTALTAAAHALADGILSWREGKIPLDRLLHEAATPGGIAATVMSAMDQKGHAATIEAGLRAGITRARANAKR